VDDPSVPELDDAAAAEPTAGDEEPQEDTGSGASGEEPTAPQEDVDTEDGDGGEQPDASQDNVKRVVGRSLSLLQHRRTSRMTSQETAWS
jgi:hypothetical protein